HARGNAHNIVAYGCKIPQKYGFSHGTTDTVTPAHRLVAPKFLIVERSAVWRRLLERSDGQRCWLLRNSSTSEGRRKAGDPQENKQSGSGLRDGASAVESAATAARRFAVVGSPQGVVGRPHGRAE